MHTAASKREEIQLKLEILRQEREREQRAFDELAGKNLEMTAAEVAQAALRKAAEEEPTSLKVGETILRVGDYVQTIDDMSTLLREEKGIFIPDPVKQVYLGERGKITRVIPSFQGKSAVEMRFADGASKVFLTECLDIEDRGRGSAKNSSGQQKPRCETSTGGETAPGVTPQSKPEAPPQPTWEMIGELRRAACVQNAKELRRSSELKANKRFDSTRLPSTDELWNAATPAPPTIIRCGGKPMLVSSSARAAAESNPSLSSTETRRSGSDTLRTEGVSPTLTTKSRVQKKDGAAKPLNTPRERGSGGVALASSRPPGSRGPRESPAVEIASPQVKPPEACVPRGGNHRSLPTGCPTNYQPKYSLNDGATGIPRLDSKDVTAKPRRCKVAGVLPGQIALQFKQVVLSGQAKTLPCVLDILTQALGWESSGRRVKRLFTTEGVEIARAEFITDGISLVATTGHVYACPPAPSKGVKVEAASAEASRIPAGRPATGTPVRKSHSIGGSGAAGGQPKQQPKQQERVHCAPHTAPGKGILRPISVRVFENGEYGDRNNDRFPFRTVTLRPAHKTMRAVMNTVERELEWHALGKKVDTIYDATGCEVTSVDQLTDGQALVASAGDRFVIPHSSSILHEEVMKLSASSDYLPRAAV
ncbi:hypothetical protein DPX39_030030900 [Trypanosoma brucei equiperdum]|uniref:Doublecortin domain-containing protein n=1 Tax=Trypanosoma brucei equiperdum TaxID=630700 RepID=A0A3L6LC98_9TRYP|nr:hypothetical protein DPX39_030030900 [Trypanosoma brucei equiperdum]